MSEQIEVAARALADLFETSQPLFSVASGSPKAFANGLDEATAIIEKRFNALSALAGLLNEESEKDELAQGAAIDLFQCSGFFYLALMQYSENLPNMLLAGGYDISVGRMPPVVSKALRGLSFAMKNAIAADLMFIIPHLEVQASVKEFEGRAQVLLDKTLSQSIARTAHAVSALKEHAQLDGYEMTAEDEALRALCQTTTELLIKLVKHSAKPQDLAPRIASFQEFLED